MARTSKKKIQIFDEGIVIADDVDSLDFTGSGISGTAVEKNVTESVPGGGSDAESFEKTSKNIKSYPYSISYSAGDIDSITYDLGGGLEIVKTFGYTSGDVTSITLSGDTPAGIDLVKTISYSGGAVDNVIYS